MPIGAAQLKLINPAGARCTEPPFPPSRLNVGRVMMLGGVPAGGVIKRGGVTGLW